MQDWFQVQCYVRRVVWGQYWNPSQQLFINQVPETHYVIKQFAKCLAPTTVAWPKVNMQLFTNYNSVFQATQISVNV